MTINNQWFGIADAGLVLRATTTDDTSTAWAANVPKELAIHNVANATAATYTVAAATTGDVTAQLYLAVMVKATTPPTLVAQPMTAGVSILTPWSGITTTTAQTTPAITDGSLTFAAGAAATTWPYAYVIGA